MFTTCFNQCGHCQELEVMWARELLSFRDDVKLSKYFQLSIKAEGQQFPQRQILTPGDDHIVRNMLLKFVK
jgi:hypothetical protein